MVGNPLSTGATSEMKKLDSPHLDATLVELRRNSAECRLQIRRNNKADLPDFGMDFGSRTDLYFSVNGAISSDRFSFRFPICKMIIKRPGKRERFDLSAEVPPSAARRGRQNYGQLLPAAPRGAGLAVMALAGERASRRMSRIAFHSFGESSVV